MTPERVKELVERIRATRYGYILTSGETAEIVAALDSHARMLGAGMPESIAKIEHTLDGMVSGGQEVETSMATWPR